VGELFGQQGLGGLVEAGFTEVLPCRHHGWAQVFHEVGQSAGPAAEVEGQERSTRRPPDTQRAGDHIVELVEGDDTFGDEVDAFLEDRRLQAVRDEPGDLFPELQRHLADTVVEIHRSGGQLPGGQRRRNHLHQRHQVRRVERMTDQQPRRVGHQRVLHRRRQRRARRAQATHPPARPPRWSSTAPA